MRTGNNRFDDFFDAGRYASLKNLLYNYRIRMKMVERMLNFNSIFMGPMLEVGSGISPLVKNAYTLQSDLSLNAMAMLKSVNPKTKEVLADVTSLPFKTGVFQCVVCSEVLEC